jgi:trehalose 6-phosphate phosphatase
MPPTDLFRKNAALLLDFDGTLVDLVPDSAAVTVDPGVRESLLKLTAEKHVPVAIVTGRQIQTIDRHLKMPQIPVSGNHGTEIRLSAQEPITRHAPPIPPMLWLSLRAICKEFDCILEDKVETAVISAPNAAAFHAARGDLEGVLAENFHSYAIWPAGFSLEIHNKSYSKITGIREILSYPAFRGYKPVYIGDDVGVYPGLDALKEEKVALVPVGEKAGAEGFSSSRHLREFLAQYANRKNDGNIFASLIAEYGFSYR